MNRETDSGAIPAAPPKKNHQARARAMARDAGLCESLCGREVTPGTSPQTGQPYRTCKTCRKAQVLAHKARKALGRQALEKNRLCPFLCGREVTPGTAYKTGKPYRTCEPCRTRLKLAEKARLKRKRSKPNTRLYAVSLWIM